MGAKDREDEVGEICRTWDDRAALGRRVEGSGDLVVVVVEDFVGQEDEGLCECQRRVSGEVPEGELTVPVSTIVKPGEP